MFHPHIRRKSRTFTENICYKLAVHRNKNTFSTSALDTHIDSLDQLWRLWQLWPYGHYGDIAIVDKDPIVDRGHPYRCLDLRIAASEVDFA